MAFNAKSIKQVIPQSEANGEETNKRQPTVVCAEREKQVCCGILFVRTPLTSSLCLCLSRSVFVSLALSLKKKKKDKKGKGRTKNTPEVDYEVTACLRLQTPSRGITQGNDSNPGTSARAVDWLFLSPLPIPPLSSLPSSPPPASCNQF